MIVHAIYNCIKVIKFRSFDKSFSRNLKTIAGANESRISSSFISASSFESAV